VRWALAAACRQATARMRPGAEGKTRRPPSHQAAPSEAPGAKDPPQAGRDGSERKREPKSVFPARQAGVLPKHGIGLEAAHGAAGNSRPVSRSLHPIPKTT